MKDEEKSFYWMMGLGYLGITILIVWFVRESLQNEFDSLVYLGLFLIVSYLYHMEKRLGVPDKVKKAARTGILLAGTVIYFLTT